MKGLHSLRELFKKLLYIMTSKQKKQFLIIFLMIFVGTLLELLAVTIIMPLIYAIMSPELLLENPKLVPLFLFLGIDSSTKVVLALSIGTIALYWIKNVYVAISYWWQIRYRAQFQKDLSLKILRSYMQRPYIFFTRTNSGLLLRGVSTAVTGVYEILDNISKFITDVLCVALISMMVVVVDPLMAIGVVLFAIICFVFVTLFFKERVRDAGKKYWEAMALTNKYAIQAINGYKEIKVRSASDYFVDNYSDASEISKKANINNAFIGTLPDRIIETVCITGIICVVFIRMMLDVNVAEFIPGLAGFAVAAFRILPSISRMTGEINAMVYWQPTLDETYNNLKDIELDKYDTLCLNTSYASDKKTLTFNDKIEIKNVFWKYDKQREEVLKDVSIDIYKGASIGIIGSSGAGKTTLMDMLLGLFRPQQGSITVDGDDIYDAPKAWAKMVGYVPQNIYLLDESIRQNVAFGVKDEEIDDEKVWRALKQASLEEFVNSLPDKLDHILGEGGAKLSGGQRQRIAIARALYFDPEIMVLDEATSALDNETEKAVMESIDFLQRKKTIIIVAHRLTTIQNCDKIYEIVDGHAELRDRDSIIERIKR